MRIHMTFMSNLDHTFVQCHSSMCEHYFCGTKASCATCLVTPLFCFEESDGDSSS